MIEALPSYMTGRLAVYAIVGTMPRRNFIACRDFVTDLTYCAGEHLAIQTLFPA